MITLISAKQKQAESKTAVFMERHMVLSHILVAIGTPLMLLGGVALCTVVLAVPLLYLFGCI